MMIRIKERLFKLFGGHYTYLAMHYRQLQTCLYSVLHFYQYDAERYAGSFLEQPCEFEYSDDLVIHVDRIIYIFWTGDNEITPNRLEGIKSLEKVCGAEVKLITPKNLPDYIKDDDPLPEAYQYLSYVHRADYLRSYFMYHFGGGYADIKTYFKSWVHAFEKLEQSDAYVIGYPEVGFKGVANQTITNELLKKDLHYHWRYLVGNGAYICRPHTKFTAEWHLEAKRRLIEKTDTLRNHPAQDPYGTNKDYPIAWSELLGGIFHPLCLKYKDKLLKDKALMPSFENYR